MWWINHAQAATWVVDQSGTGDATTIAEGLALLEDGDTLHVNAGVYLESDLLVWGKAITLEGDGFESTVIDGSAATDWSGFKVTSGTAAIRGIAFRGFSQGGNSGEYAIDVTDGVLEVANAFFEDNTTAIFVTGEDADVTVHSTTFQSNHAGVSLYIQADRLRVEDSLFLDNEYGVTISAVGSGPCFNSVEVVHNTFVDTVDHAVSANDTYETCEMSSRDFTLNIIDNLFVGGEFAWWINQGFNGDLRNNVVSPTVLNGGYNGSVHNLERDTLSAEPSFVAWSYDGDWTNDDFHLVPGSPGVDYGAEGYNTSDTDFAGTPRALDGDADGLAIEDVGAFELDLDLDDDGALDAASGGTDCDDTDPTIHPGATEICGDLRDQDCDGADLPCDYDTGGPPDTADAADTDDTDDDSQPTADTSTAPETPSDGASCGCGTAARPTVELPLIAVLFARRRRRDGRQDRRAPQPGASAGANAEQNSGKLGPSMRSRVRPRLVAPPKELVETSD